MGSGSADDANFPKSDLPPPPSNQKSIKTLQPSTNCNAIENDSIIIIFWGVGGGGGNHLLIIDSYQCHLSVNWRLWGRQ